jgi:hypothetical protein
MFRFGALICNASQKWWDKVSIDVAAEAFAVARQQSLEVMSRYSDGSFLWSFGGPLKKEGWEGISLRTPQLAILGRPCGAGRARGGP